MIARFLMAGPLLISICFAAVSHAQEQTPPIATSSPTAPASASAVLSSTVIPTPSATPPQLAEALFKNLKARSIGPAVMGGRVSDIAIDPRNPFVFYVGLGHGGVFKTNDNGVTFQPIFDKQPMLSIGAVAVAPSDSDVVWVGDGRSQRSEFIGLGRRRVSVDRWWRHMAECWAQRKPHDCADCCRSEETGGRLRSSHGQFVEGRWRTRVI